MGAPDKTLLTNFRDVKIEVQDGSILDQVIKDKRMVCINEGTKNRINILSDTGKKFGLRIHNALIAPICLTKYLG
jgi:membrane protease subunit (stomatin/prohibitin family)